MTICTRARTAPGAADIRVARVRDPDTPARALERLVKVLVTKLP